MGLNNLGKSISRGAGMAGGVLAGHIEGGIEVTENGINLSEGDLGTAAAFIGGVFVASLVTTSILAVSDIMTNSSRFGNLRN